MSTLDFIIALFVYVDFIIALFVYVDDRMKEIKPHSQEKLSPSQLVTLGLLFALKGGKQSQFFRWITLNWLHLFPHLAAPNAAVQTHGCPARRDRALFSRGEPAVCRGLIR